MAAAEKVVVPIDWKAADALPQAPTGQHTQIQVKKASIPLVFVPGIMGSRLERADKSFCWDPDSTWGMLHNYGGIVDSSGATGAERKTLLIDNPNANGTRRVIGQRNGSDTSGFRTTLLNLWVKTHYFKADEVNLPKWTWLPDSVQKLQGTALAGKMADIAILQGWTEVAWGFYGNFLLKLAATTFPHFKWIFHHPVYAIGYDWVGDNRLAGAELTKRIAQIKKQEQAYGRECTKVILVSHSMGGLASRASVVPGVAADCSAPDILGVIHGAQPSTGAPAAYRRMRGGFEPGKDEGFKEVRARGVLGLTSSQVVPVLGGCVGGLELLPTKLYRFVRNGTEQTLWLFQKEKDGSLGEGMPKSGDPYSEIYREDKDFLRLVYDPNLLDPGAKPVQRQGNRSAPNADKRSDFLLNLQAAEAFHESLQDKVHPATFITWGDDPGLGTFDHILYAFDAKADPKNAGAGSDLDPKPPDGSQPSWFTMDGPRGPGDQTVPASSGSMLLKRSLNSGLHGLDGKPLDGARKGYEHSAFYNDPAVLDFVIAAVQELSFQFREDTIHK